MEMGNQAMVMVAIVMVAGMASLVEGQLGNTPSCAADMTNCVNYLNSTNPPASCCDPLRQTVSTQLKCLCDLLNDPSLFQSMGINLTQAEQLPQNCGMPNTVAACSQLLAPSLSPSASVATTSSSGSGVGKLAWNGMSTLLVLLASMVVIRDLSLLN